MGDSALLTLLSVIISAIITSIGTVVAAYISRDKERKAVPAKETILRPPGYDLPSLNVERRRFWNKRSIAIIILALIIVGVSTRWLLGEYASKNTRLEFVSGNDSTALNPILQWDAGSSELSTYSLNGGALSIVAGPHTWPNFPMVYYEQPVTGNFSAQVKVIFAPEAPVLTTAQMVGLLARPVNARLVQSDTSFPPDWVATGKTVTDAGSLVGCRGSWDDFSSNVVYLRLERDADSWRCAYSDNGKNWVWLNAAIDDAQLRGTQLVVALFAYSITDHSITAEFSDWMISRSPR